MAVPNQRRIKKAAIARKPTTTMAVGRQRTKSSAKAPTTMAVGRQPTRSSAPAQTAAPARAGGVAPATAPAAPTAASVAPAAAGSVDLARQTYPQFEWALNDAELGPLLTKAAAEGWDENRLRGGLWKTNWFRTHGTAKVASQLEDAANDYLMPLSVEARRDWAMKIIRNEVAPTEFTAYLRESAKSAFPTLAAAIDRGITVRQYADPYVQSAARTLELPPESINLMDPKWRRFLDGARDEKGQPMVMSLSEAERTMKTDATYGFDRTKQARQQAAEFAGQLLEKFGRVG